MYPYLLHLPVLTVVGSTGLVDAGPPAARTLLFVAASLLFCIMTSWKPLRLLTAIVVEPRTLFPPSVPRQREDAVEEARHRS